MQRGEWEAHCLQMQKAWDLWIEKDHLTFQELAWCVKSVCLGPGDWQMFAYHGIADSMLKRAREHGVIQFNPTNGLYSLAQDGRG